MTVVTDLAHLQQMEVEVVAVQKTQVQMLVWLLVVLVEAAAMVVMVRHLLFQALVLLVLAVAEVAVLVVGLLQLVLVPLERVALEVGQTEALRLMDQTHHLILVVVGVVLVSLLQQHPEATAAQASSF